MEVATAPPPPPLPLHPLPPPPTPTPVSPSPSSSSSSCGGLLGEVKVEIPEHFEEVKILDWEGRVPSGLCTQKEIFDEIFSLDTWNSALGAEQRERIMKMLPPEIQGQSGEAERTMELLFSRELTRFGENPLDALFDQLLNGHYDPEVVETKEKIVRLWKREAVRQQKRYHTKLLQEIIVSREKTLRQFMRGYKGRKRPHPAADKGANISQSAARKAANALQTSSTATAANGVAPPPPKGKAKKEKSASPPAKKAKRPSPPPPPPKATPTKIKKGKGDKLPLISPTAPLLPPPPPVHVKEAPKKKKKKASPPKVSPAPPPPPPPPPPVVTTPSKKKKAAKQKAEAPPPQQQPPKKKRVRNSPPKSTCPPALLDALPSPLNVFPSRRSPTPPPAPLPPPLPSPPTVSATPLLDSLTNALNCSNSNSSLSSKLFASSPLSSSQQVSPSSFLPSPVQCSPILASQLQAPSPISVNLSQLTGGTNSSSNNNCLTLNYTQPPTPTNSLAPPVSPTPLLAGYQAGAPVLSSSSSQSSTATTKVLLPSNSSSSSDEFEFETIEPTIGFSGPKTTTITTPKAAPASTVVPRTCSLLTSCLAQPISSSSPNNAAVSAALANNILTSTPIQLPATIPTSMVVQQQQPPPQQQQQQQLIVTTSACAATTTHFPTLYAPRPAAPPPPPPPASTPLTMDAQTFVNTFINNATFTATSSAGGAMPTFLRAAALPQQSCAPQLLLHPTSPSISSTSIVVMPSSTLSGSSLQLPSAILAPAPPPPPPPPPPKAPAPLPPPPRPPVSQAAPLPTTLPNLLDTDNDLPLSWSLDPASPSKMNLCEDLSTSLNLLDGNPFDSLPNLSDELDDLDLSLVDGLCDFEVLLSDEKQYASFFSLIRDVLCSTRDHRMTLGSLEKTIRKWAIAPSAALNPWFSRQTAVQWAAEGLVHGLNFLAGNYAEVHPEDFVPYIEYKYKTKFYQWIGAGRDGDNNLTPLCTLWMENLDRLPVPRKTGEGGAEGEEAASASEDGEESDSALGVGGPTGHAESDKRRHYRRLITPPPPRFVTDWAVRPSTEEEREDFRSQERARYENPHKAFTYRMHAYESVVGPVKGVYSSQTGMSNKARGHSLLVDERPPYVTILALVRDAVARLPNGEGTRSEICEMLRDSAYLAPDASIVTLNSVVSGALDRLHYERDPCVRYDSHKKNWIYLHRDRNQEQFERLHHNRSYTKSTKSRNGTRKSRKGSKSSTGSGASVIYAGSSSSSSSQCSTSALLVENCALQATQVATVVGATGSLMAIPAPLAPAKITAAAAATTTTGKPTTIGLVAPAAIQVPVQAPAQQTVQTAPQAATGGLAEILSGIRFQQPAQVQVQQQPQTQQTLFQEGTTRFVLQQSSATTSQQQPTAGQHILLGSGGAGAAVLKLAASNLRIGDGGGLRLAQLRLPSASGAPQPQQQTQQQQVNSAPQAQNPLRLPQHRILLARSTGSTPTHHQGVLLGQTSTGQTVILSTGPTGLQGLGQGQITLASAGSQQVQLDGGSQPKYGILTSTTNMAAQSASPQTPVTPRSTSLTSLLSGSGATPPPNVTVTTSQLPPTVVATSSAAGGAAQQSLLVQSSGASNQQPLTAPIIIRSANGDFVSFGIPSHLSLGRGMQGIKVIPFQSGLSGNKTVLARIVAPQTSSASSTSSLLSGGTTPSTSTIVCSTSSSIANISSSSNSVVVVSSNPVSTSSQ